MGSYYSFIYLLFNFIGRMLIPTILIVCLILVIRSIVKASKTQEQANTDTFITSAHFEEAKKKVPSHVIEKCEQFVGEPQKLKVILTEYVNLRICSQDIADVLNVGFLKIGIYQNAEASNQEPADYIFSQLPKNVVEICQHAWHDPSTLKARLDQCLVKGSITQAAASVLLDICQAEHYEQLQSSNVPCQLSLCLKGMAPDYILEHCDSIADSPVLLETYLMQCVNQGKITQATANILKEKYEQIRNR